MNDGLFSARNTNTIAATTSSQTRTLPSGGGSETVGGPTIVVYNDGPGLVFVTVGIGPQLVALTPSLSTNVGTSGHTPIPIGQSHPFQLAPTDTNWAAISLSTSNVYCTRGDGR